MQEKEPEYKEAFIKRYSQLTEFASFKAISETFLRRCIRVNTIKISVPELKKRLEGAWELTPVPWCKEGFWIKNTKDGRRDIGNLIEHTLGYIYVQEAASMIPPVVLDVKPGDVVLDMCAAPGSKAGQIAQMLEGKGILFANDFKGDRIAALGINLQRIGATNVVFTHMRGRGFQEQIFEKVLVDAPCSGTGTIRKSYAILRMWNPGMVKRLSYAQRKLILTGFDVLKPGGTLVYSTCTMEPEENEGVVDYLLKERKDARVSKIKLPIKRSPCVLEFEGTTFDSSIAETLRIWPQDNDTEGFFVAKISKRK